MADSSIPPWLAAVLGVGGAVAGRAVGNSSASNNVPPELSQLAQIATQRAAYQNPVFQATNQGIYGMLPDFAKQGTSLSGSLSNQVPAAQSSGNGMNPLLAAGLGAGGMGLLDSLLKSNGGSNVPFDAIIKGLKKLFGQGGGQSFQGDKPQPGGAMMGPNTTGSGYSDQPQSSWQTGLPWEQPYLPSDPGFYTDINFPSDPSGGTGVGPGMADYYGGGGQATDPMYPYGRP